MSLTSDQGQVLLIALCSFSLYDGDTSHRQQLTTVTTTMSVASVQGPALLIALWSSSLYNGDTSH